MPETHVWLTQEVGLPHCPAPLQISTPLPEHCVAPGVHDPVQAPPLQIELHAVGGPHNPVVGSHCSTELPEHVVWSGAHSPVQLPAPRHVVLPHEVRVPHVPVLLHICVLLPTHWLVPGAHATHVGGEPFRQAGVVPEHVAPVCHVPLALHVWMLLPRHSVCPGAH